MGLATVQQYKPGQKVNILRGSRHSDYIGPATIVSKGWVSGEIEGAVFYEFTRPGDINSRITYDIYIVPSDITEEFSTRPRNEGPL